FFFSSRRRHTRFSRDWSSDVALPIFVAGVAVLGAVSEGAVRAPAALAALVDQVALRVQVREELVLGDLGEVLFVEGSDAEAVPGFDRGLERLTGVGSGAFGLRDLDGTSELLVGVFQLCERVPQRPGRGFGFAGADREVR